MKQSYRHFPADVNVISWLGAYYVKAEAYEKAIKYFQRGSQLEPNDIKWLLMIASCHRRTRSYQQAKTLYEEIHRKQPDNVECTTFYLSIIGCPIYLSAND